MPRRKAQGINLQKRTVVVKSQNSAHNKKTLNYEKTKDANDCVKQSSVKTPNRVPDITISSTIDKNVSDLPTNDSYLHKKFKKIAEISAGIGKTESKETESKVRNGFGNDMKRIESYGERVPKMDERILGSVKSASAGGDCVKSSVDGGGDDDASPRNESHKSPRTGSTSPPVIGDGGKSPNGKKEDVQMSANPGRYVCPYCQLACAKPSVLQKHIRAHTNERPYPCSPCGFAFKTKSNLYKHRRSQAHRFKTGEGQSAGDKCESGDELSDDSSSAEFPTSRTDQPEPPVVQKTSQASDPETNENHHKIYKPKFHKATLYQDETETSATATTPTPTVSTTTAATAADDKPRLKIPIPGKEPGKLFAGKSLPPSPEFLHQHISKIISDNQAIVETMEPQWTKKFLQRQNSREKEMASPLSNLSSSPGSVDHHYIAQKYNSDLTTKKKDETKSKLALALLKSDKVETTRYSSAYPKPEVNSDTHTYQPLNLTKKDSDDKVKFHHHQHHALGGSTIKEILIKSREAEAHMGQYSPRTRAEMLSSLQTQSKTSYAGEYYQSESPEKEAASVEAPYLSPGPRLGSTPLVDFKTEPASGPPPKKRRVHSTPYPPEPDLHYRRLSTSSLPSTNGLAPSPSRPSSSPSTTLKSLEELSKHPMKPTAVNMFGGEVKIMECGETKTVRIESMAKTTVETTQSEETAKIYMTIAKTGLHSGGGTIVQVPATTSSTTAANSFQMANILNYPEATKLLMPIVPNISTPNLTVPGVPAPAAYPKDGLEKQHNGGILTIVHGGKQIPYVPGIPGPQTVLPTTGASVASTPATKSTVSSLISVRKLSSSSQPKNVPNEIPKIEISCPRTESSVAAGTVTTTITTAAAAAETTTLTTVTSAVSTAKTTESGLKFLRPTSLPLRPGSFTPKRLHQGITPTVLSLVSPETPRPKKSYGQLFLNGHAYTYLGLKCSTRSYYCTISRPQPMYVVQTPQHPKLSMYSNWKVYSESEPSLLGLTPAKAIAHYDSRHRSSAYTIADKNKSSTGLVTHSSSWLKSSDKPPGKDDVKGEGGDGSAAIPKRVKIFAGGYASNEDYTYVRGRGRGRYVCEECGIRCKKPSMLKKHIRTHKDVRPYTCKHCTFSFKTKGNLTKHMKSKAHYKKCMEMNISPIPTTVEAENIDEELLVQQQAMRQDGNEESDNEEEEEEDDSDGVDEEETTTEDPESLEREAVCSLLSLSETTRSSQYKSLYISAGLVPKNANAVRPSTYPYATVKGTADDEKDAAQRVGSSSQSYPSSKTSMEKTYESEERPIDLSQKESRSDVAFLSKDSEFLAKPRPVPQVTSTIPVPAYLLASITNAGMQQQQHDKMATDLAGSHMLQAYLTAKALHDVKMKQQQNHRTASTRFAESDESDNLNQFDRVSQLHQNFCRIYEKTVENDSVGLKRFRDDRNGVPERKRSFDVSSAGTGEPSRKVSLSDLGVNRLVEVSKAEEEKSAAEPAIVNERTEEEKGTTVGTEKSENVSVTVETSSGKMILVSFPTAAETERLNSPPTGFLAKPGDNKLKAEFFPPSSGPSPSYVSVTEDGRSICVMCNKIFTKASQLKLHVNIHYFERPFRCEACAVSFRTKGHLLKHERSGSHHNKVSMNTTFGTATTSNPRPFKCDDCKIAFRIHGHLAKHLRSKMHIMKLECIGKLPFGTYAEMERSGVNLNEIDTTDCENSLESLQVLAQKLYEKDPSKLGQLENSTTKLNHSTNEDDTGSGDRDGGVGVGPRAGGGVGAPTPVAGVVNEGDSSSSDGFQFSLESPEKHGDESNELVCTNSRISIKKEVLQARATGRGVVPVTAAATTTTTTTPTPGKRAPAHGCTFCDDRFDTVAALQVHVFAEHSSKDMKMDLLNNKVVNGKTENNIEKTIKSTEESLIDTEKGK